MITFRFPGGYVIFILSLFLTLFIFLGSFPIYILDEARNAEAAREMLISGNYIVPHFNGVLRTDKPPLHYFFMIAGFKLFGINAFGARFFSLVFGILTIWVSYRAILRNSERITALIFLAIMLSAPVFMQEFRLAVPDPYLIFFTTLSLISFFDWYTSKKTHSLLIFYGALAFGTLAKGPVAVFLPVVAIGLFLLLRQSIRFIRHKGNIHLIGWLIYMLITVPWFYLVHVETEGQWTRGFFLEHNLNRYSDSLEGHNGSFLKMISFIIMGLFPFSIFLIPAIRFAVKKAKEADFIFYALCIALVYTVFFSFSGTQLPNYPMPAYPFIAILLASFLKELGLGYNAWRKFRIYGIVIFIVALCIPILVAGLTNLIPGYESFRFFSLYFLALPVGTGIALYFAVRHKLRLSFLIFSGSWILMSVLFQSILFPKVSQFTPLERGVAILSGEKPIVVYKRMDSAFPFNLNRVLPVANNLQELKEFLTLNPKSYILTNHKGAALDSLDILNLIYTQKSPIENHVTRIYNVK